MRRGGGGGHSGTSITPRHTYLVIVYHGKYDNDSHTTAKAIHIEQDHVLSLSTYDK